MLMKSQFLTLGKEVIDKQGGMARMDHVVLDWSQRDQQELTMA